MNNVYPTKAANADKAIDAKAMDRILADLAKVPAANSRLSVIDYLNMTLNQLAAWRKHEPSYALEIEGFTTRVQAVIDDVKWTERRNVSGKVKPCPLCGRDMHLAPETDGSDPGAVAKDPGFPATWYCSGGPSGECEHQERDE